MAKHQFLPAKKSLGQNFLHAKGVIRKIVETAGITARETVLEVGPGKGSLTEELLAAGAHVIAVEKDDRLVPYLQERFANEITEGKLELVHGDILKFSIFNFQFSKKPYKLVANIPYYITGALIRKFLEAKHQPSRMVLLVQKEVAERIVSRDGKESILSLSVKAYGVPEFVEKVKASCFRPIPGVDSAILLIKNISKVFFEDISEEKFFKTVRKGFAQKRKMLAGNLGIAKETLSGIGVVPNARAENVPLSAWKKLAETL